MIHKTHGIVFRFTKFRETSIIVTIFTELFGLQSYIVNGVRSSGKTSGNKIALYQPLTLLDLVVYHRENANINRIKEVKCLYPYRTLTVDVRKATLCMFINEVLNKAVHEESHAEEIFEFIREAMVTLDAMDSGVENFHLLFLIKLSRYLGFGPQTTYEVLGTKLMEPQTEAILSTLLHAEFSDSIAMPLAIRRELLNTMVRFYAEHLESFGELKSMQVLRELFA